jgi:phosphatidylglycerophosphate synthase
MPQSDLICFDLLGKSSLVDLDALRKPADGLVSRWLNRRVSLAITRRLAGIPITPNQISIFTMLLGMASGVAVAQGAYAWGVFGAVLLQLQSTLDGVDGELARLRSQCTRLGQWLDTVSDDLAEFSFLLGLTVATPSPTLKTLGLCGLAAYAAAKGVLYYFLATVFRSGNLQDFKWEVGAPRSWTSHIELLFKHDFLCLFFLVLALAGRPDLALLCLAFGSFAMLAKLLQQLLAKRIRAAATVSEGGNP